MGFWLVLVVLGTPIKARHASVQHQAARWAFFYAARLDGDDQRPVKREQRWRGLCVTKVARTESGPGLRRRPSGTALSALGFGAAVESSAGFEARESAPMASSSGLTESAEMSLACMGRASAMAQH